MKVPKRYKTTIINYFANLDEFEAAWAAKNGNFAPLADFVITHEKLNTKLARDLVYERLMELPRKRGLKRTSKQMARELNIYTSIQDLMAERNITKNKAMDTYMKEVDHHIAKETLREYEMKGRKVYEELINSLPDGLSLERFYKMIGDFEEWVSKNEISTPLNKL